MTDPKCIPLHECKAWCCKEISFPVLKKPSKDFTFWIECHGGKIKLIDDTWKICLPIRCLKLTPDNKCLIYNSRPQICRDFYCLEAKKNINRLP